MAAGVMIPSWWSEAAESIASAPAAPPPPIALVCGPANSGKSVFSRHLLDNLLQRYERVGYLDTDVGQPEFTAPGCQSLHIIPQQTLPDLTILCLKAPEKCFFFGDINCGRDPKTYLKNIFSLYDYFLKQYYHPGQSVVPLVINTSGWVKGIGYDLLVEILRYTSPTHVVQILISAERKNLPSGMFWLDGNAEGSAKLIEIHAAQNESTSQSARVSIRKDACILRELRLIAYFRQCLPRDFNISSHKELVHSLASTPPYAITLSKVKVMHLHCQVSNTETYEGLKAAIVGLAISSSGPVSPEHSTPWCVGLGIVRAMDVSKDQLYVVTPIPLRIVEKVDIILQGLIEIPTCLLEVSQVQDFVSPCMDTNVLQEQDAPRSLGTSR